MPKYYIQAVLQCQLVQPTERYNAIYNRILSCELIQTTRHRSDTETFYKMEPPEFENGQDPHSEVRHPDNLRNETPNFLLESGSLGKCTYSGIIAHIYRLSAMFKL